MEDRPDTPEQRALDARCIRFHHHRREVEHCANPYCPSRRPELWTELLKLQDVREQGEG
ncbi:MAG: hypothetical protein H6737_19140 [Alphaproteobacteria bacterium]|nr:hypothetical protein [Alphaproteobacteria bacterium]